jgi:Spy/CpxP family protein refolding chaperone
MEIPLNTFKALTLTAALMLSTAAGAALAQQATDAWPPAAQTNAGPGQDGCVDMDGMGGIKDRPCR